MAGRNNHKHKTIPTDQNGVGSEFITQLQIQADELADQEGGGDIKDLCQLVRRLTYLITALYRGGCSKADAHTSSVEDLDARLRNEMHKQIDDIKSLLESSQAPRFGWPAATAYITTLLSATGLIVTFLIVTTG